MASSARRTLYPAIKPYRSGWLRVSSEHEIYWEECGNPQGKPAVFVHGGPGAGAGESSRRFFDPRRYRIVLFDQRGAGRSTPHADLTDNDTWSLVADIEKLRERLGIERWQVFGGSWGSTLALAYAETHPQRVTELVLRGIFTLRRFELDWYYNGGAGHLSPEWWRSFQAPLGGDAFRGDRIAAYHSLLFDPDPDVHLPAGVAWTTWEASTSHLEWCQQYVDDFSDPAFALAFARIENHFFVHAGWFREGQLIEDVDRIRHIPAVIVQGRYDMVCPIVTADRLARISTRLGLEGDARRWRACAGRMRERILARAWNETRGCFAGSLGGEELDATLLLLPELGLLPASEGRAWLFGKPVDPKDLNTRRRVGYMTQAFSLYSELTVRQNLSMHAHLFDLPKEDVPFRVKEMAEKFGLNDVMDDETESLPLGIRQRLSLAVAAIHRPEILILDEPTAGLDPNQIREVRKTMRKLRETKTILLSTHILQEVEAMADRVVLINEGRKVFDGTVAELRAVKGDLDEAFHKLTGAV